MDVRSQFTGLYKNNLRMENLRTNVARRKSLCQKENRHKEFRKSWGLALANVNISTVKENDFTQLEEVTEQCLPKGHDSKHKVTAKAEHLLKLQRFKEEKQLRKLKEREKAKRGIFKCGLYKPGVAFSLIMSSQNAIKVKQDEKPAPPAVTRITRSMAIAEPTTKMTARSQHVTAGVQNRAKLQLNVQSQKGQSSTVKNEKVNQGVPPVRATGATAATAVEVPTKSTPVVQLQTGVTKENKAKETVQNQNIEHQIVDQCSVHPKEPEVPLKETALEMETPVKASAPVRERKKPFAPQNLMLHPWMACLPSISSP
ncbi:hypothetical protein FKM82_026727 [Ascaphus truei]